MKTKSSRIVFYGIVTLVVASLVTLAIAYFQTRPVAQESTQQNIVPESTETVDSMVRSAYEESVKPIDGCKKYPAANTSIWIECNERISSQDYRAVNVLTDNGWHLHVVYDLTLGNHAYYEFDGVSEEASWSPDGYHVAFLLDGEIHIADVRLGTNQPSYGDNTGIKATSMDTCEWSSEVKIDCTEQ